MRNFKSQSRKFTLVFILTIAITSIQAQSIDLPVNLFQSATHSSSYVGESGTLRLLNYNIASLRDDEVSETLSFIYDRGINPAVNVPKIVQKINTLNKWDVVLFQEDWDSHGQRVRNEIDQSKYPYLGTHNVDKTSNYNNPISWARAAAGNYDVWYRGDGLYRYGKVPFSDLQREKFDDCEGGDCLSKKGFTRASYTVAPGVMIDVYNVHAESGRNAESEAVRAAGFQQMIDVIEANSQDHAVIVIGDFNARYARGQNDGLNHFVNYPFSGNRVMKDVLYDMAGWPYSQFASNGDAKESGEGVEKCFYMSSEEVEIIPTLYKDERSDFGGTPSSDGGNGWSDHPPFTTVFSYKTKSPTPQVCSEMTILSDDFNNGSGNWEKKSGTEKAKYVDNDAWRIQKNKSGSMIQTKSTFALVSSYDNYQIDYNYKTSSDWDSGDCFDVKVSLDGGASFQVIQTVCGEQDSYGWASSPLMTTLSDNMKFKFESESNNDNEKIYFTDIRITGCGYGAGNRSADEQLILSGAENIQQTSLYPNPVISHLSIANPRGLSMIEVLDLSGAVVKHVSGLNEQAYRLDVTTLQSGIYLIKVVDTDNKAQVLRFSKQ